MKNWFYTLTVVCLLLCPMAGFSFNFSVTPTHETCAGNGTLTFNVTNPDPTGSIVFVVYKLPELSTPYASLTTNFVSGLTAGTYRVFARETVGGTTTEQQLDVTINSTVIPLTYTVQSLNQACSNNSIVTVTVTSGTAATYEIFFGPVTYPIQNTNTFSGVPAGTYRMRVIDNCGNAVVQTFIVTVNPASLTIGAPVYSEVSPPSCNQEIVSNTLTPSPGRVIAYPLQVEYILYFPDGTNTHVQVVINSGDPTSQTLSQTFPEFINDEYTYDMIVTDACGATYSETFAISAELTVESTVEDEECFWFFALAVGNFAGSYTVTFDSFPAGFNPTDFNSIYPGPFTLPSITFASDTQSVPFGNYTVTVTDPCGKTKTIDFEVEYEPPTPNVVGNTNGCQATGGQIIAFISGQDIITATITEAPADYPFPLPHNVTSMINSGGVLVVSSVPIGDYVIVLTDECQDILDPQEVTVPPYEDLGVQPDLLPGCGLGRGSIRVTGRNGALVSASITSAPTSFSFPLPYTVTNNIFNGQLYLNNLPSGDYIFRTTDSCGLTANTPITIEGYTITQNDFSLVMGCGAFDIPLAFSSNLTLPDTFWLQKLLDADTDTWGHPDTEAPYVPGTVPDAVSGLQLENNTNNANLIFNGVFRIVHHFTSYNNGADMNANVVDGEIKDCVEVLSPTLTFDRVLAINDVYRVPCSTSGNLDVILFTSGEPPLHFTIIEKDGVPFFVDNGSSNVFTNLDPAIYKFQIEDNCGNTIVRTFDVSDLESLVTVYPVCNLFNCYNTITGNETFNLTTQATGILGIQSASDYTISYHTTLAGAQNNTNIITNPNAFNPTGNQQTVYIRMIFNQYPNCYQTGSFDVISGQVPANNLNPLYSICDGQSVVLDAAVGNLPITTYLWSDNSTNNSVTVSQPGQTNLTATATNAYGSCNNVPLQCTLSQDITVNIATVPQIGNIELHDWTNNENSITVTTTNQGDFEYSINGLTYQTSNTFTNLAPGVYTVSVRDINGCQIVQQVVWLLNYPQYFTPNGDGIHDTWYVKNSNNEPHFQVYIYDRYGKLITGFRSGSAGWDGTYNGRQMFSDDYWFVVHREDGRTHRGHFTLKR